jgi:hypothetical protein
MICKTKIESYLREELSIIPLAQVGEFAPGDKVAVVEDRVEKAPGWQQRLKIDHQLEESFAVVHFVLRRVTLLGNRVQNGHELDHQVEQKRSLPLLSFSLLSALLFLQCLPVFAPLRVVLQLMFTPILHGQINTKLAVNLSKVKTAIKWRKIVQQ